MYVTQLLCAFRLTTNEKLSLAQLNWISSICCMFGSEKCSIHSIGLDLNTLVICVGAAVVCLCKDSSGKGSLEGGQGERNRSCGCQSLIRGRSPACSTAHQFDAPCSFHRQRLAINPDHNLARYDKWAPWGRTLSLTHWTCGPWPVFHQTAMYQSFYVCVSIGLRGEYPNTTVGFVHIDDVVAAHILAMEEKRASGRFICSSSVAHWSQIIDMLKPKYPFYPYETE